MLGRSRILGLLLTGIQKGEVGGVGLLKNADWVAGAGVPLRSIHRDLDLPKPGTVYLRRTVHYPQTYTIKPVPTTNLAGRDPKTGECQAYSSFSLYLLFLEYV